MKPLIKSTALLTTSNIFTRVIALLFYIILARAMTVSEYGLFRYLMWLSLIYAIAFSCVSTSMTKYLSQFSKSKKKSEEYLSNGTIIIIPIFLLLAIIIFFFHVNSIFLILLLFAALVDAFYMGYARGILNYLKLAGFKLTENIIQLTILVVSFIILKQIGFSYAVIFFSFSPLVALLLFEIINPQLKISLKFSKEKIKQLVKYAFQLALGSVGWRIMISINAIFINHFYDESQVGYYSVGLTISEVFTFLPMAIHTIILPEVSALKNKRKLLKPLMLAIICSLLLSGVVLIALLILKTHIITSIFTEKYLPSVVVILPLSLGQIAISIHQILTATFQGLNKPVIPSITISIAAGLNVIGSYFLTQAYGIVGAAISHAITSIIASIIIVSIFVFRWKILSNS